MSIVGQIWAEIFTTPTASMIWDSTKDTDGSVRWSEDITTFFTSFRLCSKSNNRGGKALSNFKIPFDFCWSAFSLDLTIGLVHECPLENEKIFISSNRRMRPYSHLSGGTQVRIQRMLDTATHNKPLSNLLSSWSGLAVMLFCVVYVPPHSFSLGQFPILFLSSLISDTLLENPIFVNDAKIFKFYYLWIIKGEEMMLWYRK